MVSRQPVVLTASLTKLMVGVPQASEAVTAVISGAGTGVLHPGKESGAGHVIVGGVESIVRVIVCEQVAVLPQTSVAIYVRVVISVQPVVFIASLTKDTVGVPHASVAVTEVISGAGTIPLHPGKVTGAGHVMTGGVVSMVLVMVWLHVAVFPQPSVAI